MTKRQKMLIGVAIDMLEQLGQYDIPVKCPSYDWEEQDILCLAEDMRTCFDLD